MALFTKENAREMSRRANFKRWHRPDPAPELLVVQPAIPIGSPDPYLQRRLLRVRAIIERIEEQALKLPSGHGQEGSWLATAADKWSDQEFNLAGRPKPGNRKPAPERASVSARVQPMGVSIMVSQPESLAATPASVQPSPAQPGPIATQQAPGASVEPVQPTPVTPQP